MTAPLSINQTEVASAFGRWLRTRLVPNDLSGDEQAQDDARASLLSVMMRYAPASNIPQWVGRVTSRLAESNKYRTWPSEGEVKEACQIINSGSGSADNAAVLTGDKAKLSYDELRLLEEKILPTARRWLSIPGLAHHAKQTLAYWGEAV